MSTVALTTEDLRAVDLFDDIDDAALEQWVAVAEQRHADPGEILAEQGEEAPGLLLLLEGTAQALMLERGRSEPMGRHESPTWFAAIAVLTGGPLPVRMQAETACRLAFIPPDDFRRLVFAQPAVHRRVMQQVAPVMSRLTGIEQHKERLASLGTMAAGLAHELNNPAAAARRAAAELTDALAVISSALAHFVESGIERAQAEELLGLQQQALSQAAEATALDGLRAADAEDELLERLEALGIPEPWRLAEPLSVAGVDQIWLDAVARLAGPATPAALRWVAASLTAGRLAAELQDSTDRISALVGAVKDYSYMDRGGVIEIDLHEGLDSTLTMLGFKLKHADVDVRRDYDRTLPKLTVHGSELNQVWTNLLDNAIDAVGEKGTITVASQADGNCAVVEVTDDGPGIAPDIRERIFDPFFTTKEVGHGTGLGLATARGIVVDRLDGSLTVESQPGSTTFRVRLPFTQR
jgi:signal transduction histidine kinase